MKDTIIKEYLNTMNTELERIAACLDRLTEDQVWSRLKPDMNSVGNLCAHLAGNEYQNIVSAVGGRPFVRRRSAEFIEEGTYSKQELIRLLRETRSESISIVEGLKDSDLDKEVSIYYSREDWERMKDRGRTADEPFFVKPIRTLLFHAAEHYGYHTGQIVLITKLLQANGGSITGYKH